MNEEKGAKVHLLEHVLTLPHRIIKHHDVLELPKVVLHHLSHKKCFNFTRSAYVVDNPDFNHLRGVAGYCEKECKHDAPENLWHEPHRIDHHMSEAAFYQHVKSLLREGLKKQHVDPHDQKEVLALGEEIGIQNPSYVAWNMKHGNYGLLIYEAQEPLSNEHEKLLTSASSFLSFCPL